MSEEASNNERAVARGVAVMPVIEGALAFIVISFIASVWENIPPDRGHDAFILIYGSGAHFIFCFLIVGPVIALAARLRSAAAGAAMALALAAYVFWSLILQHRGLANLLLDSPWSIPLPGADSVSQILEYALGPQFALYFGPLIFSHAVLIAALALLWLPSTLVRPRRRSEDGRARVPTRSG